MGNDELIHNLFNFKLQRYHKTYERKKAKHLDSVCFIPLCVILKGSTRQRNVMEDTADLSIPLSKAPGWQCTMSKALNVLPPLTRRHRRHLPK
jgi:hypothetical protein